MKIKGISNKNNKDNYKKFLNETEEEGNNCPCWVCKEQRDIMKNIQRQNSFLSNIVAFDQ